MDALAFAHRTLTDTKFLVERAAVALSTIDGAFGVCIVLLPGDVPVFAIAHDGALQRVLPEASSVLKSRFVDPERVPVSQRDVWVEPVPSGFVSKKTAKRAAIAPFLAAIGVRGQIRQHVCVGPKLVAGFSHLRTTRARPPQRELDAFAAAWRPLLRAHALLASSSSQGPRRSSSSPSGLTARQQRIVDLVGDGLTNDEIATRLRVSTHTVKTVLHRLYDKTGTRGRVALVRFIARERSAGRV